VVLKLIGACLVTHLPALHKFAGADTDSAHTQVSQPLSHHASANLMQVKDFTGQLF
jgi:hypothetical protein